MTAQSSIDDRTLDTLGELYSGEYDLCVQYTGCLVIHVDLLVFIYSTGNNSWRASMLCNWLKVGHTRYAVACDWIVPLTI